jgi:hypothetical protein
MFAKELKALQKRGVRGVSVPSLVSGGTFQDVDGITGTPRLIKALHVHIVYLDDLEIIMPTYQHREPGCSCPKVGRIRSATIMLFIVDHDLVDLWNQHFIVATYYSL